MRTGRVSAAVGGVRAGLGELAEVDLAGLSEVQCLELLGALGPLVNMLSAQVTRVVGRVHRCGAARADGASSTQAWLRSRLRTGLAHAHVQAARVLPVTPEVAAAYQRGELSLEHVVEVARVVPDIPAEVLAAGADKLLAEQAGLHTPAVFHRAATRIRDHFDPDAAHRRRAKALTDRWLNVAPTFEGAVSVQGMLDPDAGELLLHTLAALTPPPRVGETRTAAQRRADALLDLCRLAGTHAPTTGGTKPQVVVTIDGDTLRGKATELMSTGGHWTGATMGSGTPIGLATARRLACDAGVIPVVLASTGEPLDIGRTTRLVPAPLRRALVVRDGHCRFPGCRRPPQWTDAHHLHPWALGGDTALRNLILLCRFHHTLVHEGGFSIRLDHDTGNVHARYPDGRPYALISRPRAADP